MNPNAQDLIRKGRQLGKSESLVRAYGEHRYGWPNWQHRPRPISRCNLCGAAVLALAIVLFLANAALGKDPGEQLREMGSREAMGNSSMICATVDHWKIIAEKVRLTEGKASVTLEGFHMGCGVARIGETVKVRIIHFETSLPWFTPEGTPTTIYVWRAEALEGPRVFGYVIGRVGTHYTWLDKTSDGL